MGKVTMRDIARQVGVSPTTVAHALNHTPDAQVAKLTRERIWQAAKELGYQQSLLRRSIKDPLRHLGIAVGRAGQDDEADTAAIFAGIREVALARGYIPILHAMPISIGQEDCSAAVEKISELHQVKLLDGVVVDKQCFANVSITELHTRGIPVVVVNGSFEAVTAQGEPIPGMVYDNYLGGRLAVEHLLGLGHRRIALLTRPFFRYSVPFRPMLIRRLLAGYRETLAAAGLAPDDTLFADASPHDRASVAAAIARLLPARPTAIFVGDDALAVMAMNALRDRGLQVPRDISVVGYGDHDLPVRLAAPELTTVRTDLHENGRRAAAMLIDLMEGRALPAPQILLPPELVVRHSTAPIP
jgi:DNA-binding LacI/PurR family transcriptional regulator